MADLEREIHLMIIEDQRKIITQITEFSKALAESNKQLSESNGKLTAEVEALTKKVEELSAALNEKKHRKNSQNSSQPPSSDGYNKPQKDPKPNPQSLRESSGKKQGGQLGHKGSGMAITGEPDETVSHYPTMCEGCPHRAECLSQGNLKCTDTHYVVDIVVKKVQIAHETYQAVCPLSGAGKAVGEFPEEAAAKKQYGPSLNAFAVTLLTQGYVSVDRTQKILEGLGIPISTGTIQNMLTRAAEKVKDAAEIIKNKLFEKFILHVDETGAYVNKVLHWIHCVCDSEWSYYMIHPKRGNEAMDEMGILPALINCILIHDFWKAYLKYDNVEHAFCNAHLERELVFAHEVSSQEWASKLKGLLSEMCKRRNELQDSGAESFEKSELEAFFDRYDQYIEEGIRLNPLPEKAPGQRGPVKRGKIRCLLDRMKKYKEEILRFATDLRVPFTNNEAERSIRFAKVKAKVSGCFRSEDGAKNFMTVMSYIGSANKHGVSIFEAMQIAFEDRAVQLVETWE